MFYCCTGLFLEFLFKKIKKLGCVKTRCGCDEKTVCTMFSEIINLFCRYCPSEKHCPQHKSNDPKVDGKQTVRDSISGSTADAVKLGTELADRLLAAGGKAILEDVYQREIAH